MAIRNQLEYRITKAEVRNFEQALERLEGRRPSQLQPRLVQAEREALQSQLKSLRMQMREYDRLRRGSQRK